MFKCGLPLLVLMLALTSCAASGVVPEAPLEKDKLTFLDFYSDECFNCMIMQPIVDKLGKQYSDHITVKPLNIDTDGKELFYSMGFRSNPVFVIMRPEGTILYKGFGRIPELALDKAVRKAIGI